MNDRKTERLVLKDDDILVMYVPEGIFNHKTAIIRLYEQIKKNLYPRKNKILILPNSINLSVIGKDRIEEYISHVDLWNLFDENGDEMENIE